MNIIKKIKHHPLKSVAAFIFILLIFFTDNIHADSALYSVISRQTENTLTELEVDFPGITEQI
jgi:hypothetical protein